MLTRPPTATTAATAHSRKRNAPATRNSQTNTGRSRKALRRGEDGDAPTASALNGEGMSFDFYYTFNLLSNLLSDFTIIWNNDL